MAFFVLIGGNFMFSVGGDFPSLKRFSYSFPVSNMNFMLIKNMSIPKPILAEYFLIRCLAWSEASFSFLKIETTFVSAVE